MKTNHLQAMVALTTTALIISCTSLASSVPTDNNDPGGGGQGNKTSLYCDYGPINQWGGGCYEIGSEADCDLQWGQIVSVCPPESNLTPSSSSIRSSSSVYVPPAQSSSSARSSSSVYIPPTQSSSATSSSNSSATPSSSSVDVGLCTGFVDGTTRLHYGRNKPQFCDERDGKKYVYMTIGEQIWMAENLNYANVGVLCNNGSESNCGRLYNWVTAMAIDAACNSKTCRNEIRFQHRGICPSGWHIPSDLEWTKLINYADGSAMAGRYFKTTSGWLNCVPGGNSNVCDPRGSDSYGFSALPNDGDAFGFWWSSDESTANNAWGRIMYFAFDDADRINYDKSYEWSVRCIKD